MQKGIFVLRPCELPESWKAQDLAAIGPLDSIGTETSQDVICTKDVPPHDMALASGWAVDNSFKGKRTIVTKSSLCNGELEIANNEALWVYVGDPLPKGANAIASGNEYSKVDEQTVSVNALYGHENVLPKGSEWKKNSVLFPANTVIEASAVALLIDANIAYVNVFKRPTVGILMSGPSEEEKEDSNFTGTEFYLRALLEKIGVGASNFYAADNALEAFSSYLSALTDYCDCILVANDRGELLKEAIKEKHGKKEEKEEREPALHGKIISEGTSESIPILLAEVNEVPVIGLPTNSIEMMMIVQRVVLPFLWKKYRTTEFPVMKKEATLGFIPPVEKGEIAIKLLEGKNGAFASPMFGEIGHAKAFHDLSGSLSIGEKPLKPGDKVEIDLFLGSFTELESLSPKVPPK